MMTKRDFERFARAIHDMPLHPQFRNLLRESAAQLVADVSAQSNPLFDRSRFLAAAGVDGGLPRETD